MNNVGDLAMLRTHPKALNQFPLVVLSEKVRGKQIQQVKSIFCPKT